MEKAKKKRTTSLLDKTVASMSRTGDTAADYAAAQRVAAAKADTTKALEGLPAHGRMTGPAGLQRKALGIVTQQGKLPSPGLLGGGDSGEEPFDADSGVAIDPSGEDTQLNQDIESYDDAILKPKGKRPPPGRVEKLAAAREKAEKEQIPLEKAVPVDEDINIILANAYMNMEHNKTLEEQIINEIENLLEETFSDEEYKIMYDYVHLYLNEGTFRAVRRTGRRRVPNMAKGYKGTKPGEPNTSPLSPEEMAKLGILTGIGAIHNSKDSDDFSKYFERIQREKNKGNQQ